MHARTRLALLVSLLLATGCLTPGPPLAVRTFELADLAPVPAPAKGAPPALLLSDVTARAPIDVQMVWRLSPVEVSLDENDRWAAPPADLVRARLERLLFESGAFRRTPASDRTLRVQLVRFEGARTTRPEARVVLEATAGHSPLDLATRRFEAAVPLDAPTPEELARGLGTALDQAVAELVAWLEGVATRG